jgi:hypothetical protein
MAVVPASELWTGDMVLLHEQHVTKLCVLPSGQVEVTMADIVPDRGDPPFKIVNEKTVPYHQKELVTILRDAPLFNGMHITQLDVRGYCHGRAHAALEQRFNQEGKLAEDYHR